MAAAFSSAEQYNSRFSVWWSPLTAAECSDKGNACAPGFSLTIGTPRFSLSTQFVAGRFAFRKGRPLSVTSYDNGHSTTAQIATERQNIVFFREALEMEQML